MQLKTFSWPLRNRRGSVAVTVAISLAYLLMILGFVIDAGYLYGEKNRFQNGVETAALSAVQRLCAGDWEAVAREIAAESGLPEDSQSLTVEAGFYDARNEYETDLGDHPNLGPPPLGRYANAVRVSLQQRVKSLGGMQSSVQVVAEAVAYLERLDMVSLDPLGAIHLGHESNWQNVTFFSNGSIEYPQGAFASGKSFSQPAFDNCRLLTADSVLSCPVDVTPFGWTGAEHMTIQWGSGAVQSGGDIQSGLDPFDDLRPVDNGYLNAWRERADVIYTPDQAGDDNVFYGQGDGPDGFYYYVDPAGSAGSQQVIFFDAEGGEGTVLIGPAPSNPNISHTPNGSIINGLTFVATCPIRIQNHMPIQLEYHIYLGGTGSGQAVIISAGDIEIHTRYITYTGVVFRTGGDFIKPEHGTDRLNHLRAIADGSIRGKPYSTYTKDPGLNHINIDARFAPPCPPALARLGTL